MAKKLNLTDEERANVTVTFSVNKYYAETHNGILVGSYYSKEDLKKDLEFQEVTYVLAGQAITAWRTGI